MTHPRQLIREAVVARLTGATDAGSRVVATRVEPLNRKGVFPVLSVYTVGEDAERGGSAPVELVRTVAVEITGWVIAAPIDNAIDQLAEQVEAAMDADPFLAGSAGDSQLRRTEITYLDDGDPIVGVLTLTYDVEYRTSPAVATGLDDFRRAATTTAIGGATAADLVTVQGAPP